MEDFLSIKNLEDLWKKPLEKYHISSDDEQDIIELISKQLIEDNSNLIQYTIYKIINSELLKKPKASLHQHLLIKQQIINNFNKNIEIYAKNTAKKIYEQYNNEIPVLTIVDNNNYMLIDYNMEIESDIESETELLLSDFK
jgi:hypothetical protein